MNRRSFGKMLAFAGLAWPLSSKGFAENIEDIGMYQVGDQKVFPLMAKDGSLISSVCVFPTLRRGKDWLVFGYYSPMSHRVAQRDEYAVRLEHDSKALFAQALRRGDPIEQRLDGDLMPKDGEIVRFRTR